ncbi:MAG: glycosyl hydrolase family protein [Caldilineae bacterium]|nr:MAG: glycosyl hydrolase family protein [Caldilineae bacterium]
MFRRFGRILLVCLCASAILGCVAPPPPRLAPPTLELPDAEEALLWLDATQGVETDADGRVLAWKDRLTGAAYTPDARLIHGAMNHLPSVRFMGGQGVRLEPNLPPGPLSVFVVYQRTESQVGGPGRQRVYSIWDGESPVDLYLPSAAEVINNGDAALEPTVRQQFLHEAGRTRIAIGMNAITGEDNFRGDIAEVLIYRRAFLSVTKVNRILAYLGEKWGAKYKPEKAFTRRGPLTWSVQRITDAYPLSDQENREGWTLYEPWSDEFDDGVLDTEKWMPYNHVWYGRAPARFLPSNVEEGFGTVKLAMRKDPSLEPVYFYPDGEEYKDYSSATLSSRTAKRYGYIEARAKAGVGSSAFWLYAETFKEGKLNRLEIDTYELGGLEKGYETLYNMNAWKFVKDGVPGRFQWHATWDAGVRFADDFHVFGLKWTEDAIEYYVDGVLVRSIINQYWHSPLLLLFDTETMPHWFGVPPDDHLPGFHEIDYVRTWINEETVDTWQGEYTLKNDPKTNNPLADYYSQLPPHVNAAGP